MDSIYALCALLLVFALLLGLVRIWRGPLPADRMLAAQLFGTSSVGLSLLLAQWMHLPALRDIALVLALLALMASVAFVARGQPQQPKAGDPAQSNTRSEPASDPASAEEKPNAP
ncbi:monovalent cation/H+ antiporter complex subunit F [Marinospirillum sp. MEB164]|uniref:Monovalent cation/H+ antiporter complex subunit F n=1 Tax=Marinospirillum alkalitolerans TaxID=3123374 RepID=A0ABW8PYT0_9GAMM